MIYWLSSHVFSISEGCNFCDSKLDRWIASTLGDPLLYSARWWVIRSSKVQDNTWKIHNLTKFCKKILYKFSRFYEYILVSFLSDSPLKNDCGWDWNGGSLEWMTSALTNWTTLGAKHSEKKFNVKEQRQDWKITVWLAITDTSWVSIICRW
jgi:hypothetical protein